MIVDGLWVEKYRPKTVSDVILPSDVKDEFLDNMKNNKLPNLLLAGPPGAGKTTLARIVTSKKGIIQNRNDNVLEINGSAKETRGINFVQDIMEPFLKVPPAGKDSYKVVFIDEGDNLTEASFKSLRGIIEKYQIRYGRFILTCNYLSKVPEPVQSRFTVYKFQQIPMDFVTNFCKEILEKENIKIDNDDALNYIIQNLYPDIRKIVSSLQRFSATGTLKVNKDTVLSNEKVVIGLFLGIMQDIKNKAKVKINKKLSETMNILDQHELEFKNLYETLFYTNGIPVPAKIIINRYANTHQNALVHRMHYMSMLFDAIKVCTEYEEMK